MPTHLLALVPSMALILANLPRTEAQARPIARPEDRAQVGTSGGFRTDRLSRKQLQTWKKIIEIVMAEDRDGQPLHPTLRRLWDAVATSGHVVFVEMPKSKSYVGGRFAVTKLDPEGRRHEGILTLNSRAIDNASTKAMAARAGGFIPFEGLGRIERYAELLGHELAHAEWHLADPERARIAQRLQGDIEAEMWMVVRAGVRGPDEELRKRVGELDRLAREVEVPAEAAEVAIWKELQAGQRTR